MKGMMAVKGCWNCVRMCYFVLKRSKNLSFYRGRKYTKKLNCVINQWLAFFDFLCSIGEKCINCVLLNVCSLIV